MSHVSRRDIDDLKPDFDKIVYKVLGSSDSTIVSTIIHCLNNDYDKRKTTDKLCAFIDSKKASRLYDKVEDIINHFKSSKSKKRSSNSDSKDKVESKKPRTEKLEKSSVSNTTEVPGESVKLSSFHIKEMMLNAQREIEERKRQLTTLKTGVATPVISSEMQMTHAITPNAGPSAPSKPEDYERAKKIADLQAQIRAKLSGTLANILPSVTTTPDAVNATVSTPIIDKPKPLILDSEGRTVDKAGRAINIPTLAPTLKANIRAKKRENFKANQISDKDGSGTGEAKFYDERLVIKPAVRNKRALRFHEPGKFQQMAERMRMKAQLEKLQNEISQIARKTGISSATKLALIAPKQDLYSDEVPQMEWWDSVILTQDLNTLDANNKIAIRDLAISNLIEHPTQMRPPSMYPANIKLKKYSFIY